MIEWLRKMFGWTEPPPPDSTPPPCPELDEARAEYEKSLAQIKGVTNKLRRRPRSTSLADLEEQINNAKSTWKKATTGDAK